MACCGRIWQECRSRACPASEFHLATFQRASFSLNSNRSPVRRCAPHCAGQRNVTRVDLSGTLYIRVSSQQSLASISAIKDILSVARLYRLLGDFVAGEVFGLSSSAKALVPAVYIGSRPTLRGPFPLQSACL